MVLKPKLCFLFHLKPGLKIQKVKLTNKGTETKTIKLFSYNEWCLWNAEDDQNNLQRNLSTGEVEIDGSTLYHKQSIKSVATIMLSIM